MTPKEILLNAIKEYKNTSFVIMVETDYSEYLCMNKQLLIGITKHGFNPISIYDKDLKTKNEEFNIKAIWRTYASICLDGLDKKNSKCLWKRENIKEVTLEEIAEKFGVDVENIRIKDGSKKH